MCYLQNFETLAYCLANFETATSNGSKNETTTISRSKIWSLKQNRY
jgi:hypothetical protein